MSLSGPEKSPHSGNAPKQLCIILHGWGADGDNLIDLAMIMGPEFPDMHFIAPNGPATCAGNPFGYEWFDLTDRDPEVLYQGVSNVAPTLNAFIDEQLAKYNLSNDELILVGFSQGTMTSLHVALRREQPCKAVVGFSGALLGAEKLPEEINSKPPVCLIHGEEDMVVPFQAMAHAEVGLKAVDVSVETHARPGIDHSIDPDGLKTAIAFIKNQF